MDENGSGGCLLPGDSYPDWLTFNSEGSSVTFEVPQVEGRMLKTITICVVYSSTFDNITSDGLRNLLVKNYTKATIQLYKREAVAAFEDEEGKRVVSSIEPGNKVEVVVVFENGLIVKKTAIYLIYDEKKCLVRKDSPKATPMDDLQHNRRVKFFKWRWKTVKEWCGKNKSIC